MMEDELCQPICNVEECEYDDHECDDKYDEECFPGCSNFQIGDGICNPECYNYDCMYDYTDCGCNPECPVHKIGDHYCDVRCNTKECLFDLGDCQVLPGDLDCSLGCDYDLLSNGR